jgi:hypothetical protein
MFQDAVNFKQGIFNWKPYACTNMTDMFLRVDMNNPNSVTNQDNYNDILNAWSDDQNFQNNVIFNAGSSKYSGAQATTGRSVLTTSKGWTITDGGGV